MGFKDESWASRSAAGGMGDQAEAVFRIVWKKGFVDIGLRRPPLQVWKLPLMERYRPDFLTSEQYIEVQGCGRDQVFKFKAEKLEALEWWNSVFPVHLFLYDSHKDRYTFILLVQVMRWIDEDLAALDTFPEGKAYWAVPAHLVFGD